MSSRLAARLRRADKRKVISRSELGEVLACRFLAHVSITYHSFSSDTDFRPVGPRAWLSPQIMEPPTLLLIPVEIRHMVYLYCVDFDLEINCCYCITQSDCDGSRRLPLAGILANVRRWYRVNRRRLSWLLVVRKQVYHETSELFFRSLSIRCCGFDSFYSWLRASRVPNKNSFAGSG